MSALAEALATLRDAPARADVPPDVRAAARAVLDHVGALATDRDALRAELADIKREARIAVRTIVALTKERDGIVRSGIAGAMARAFLRWRSRR